MGGGIAMLVVVVPQAVRGGVTINTLIFCTAPVLSTATTVNPSESSQTVILPALLANTPFLAGSFPVEISLSLSVESLSLGTNRASLMRPESVRKAASRPVGETAERSRCSHQGDADRGAGREL